jgi:hypothetical protein
MMLRTLLRGVAKLGAARSCILLMANLNASIVDEPARCDPARCDPTDADVRSRKIC